MNNEQPYIDNVIERAVTYSNSNFNVSPQKEEIEDVITTYEIDTYFKEGCRTENPRVRTCHIQQKVGNLEYNVYLDFAIENGLAKEVTYIAEGVK